MKQIYSSNNLQYCLFLKEILESEGIQCMIRNEYLSNLAGELPVEQTWPELFILDDSDILKAEKILAENKASFNEMPSFCPKCDSEEIDLVKEANLIRLTTFKCRKCNYIWNKR